MSTHHCVCTLFESRFMSTNSTQKGLLEESEHGTHAELFKESLQFCMHVVMVF